MEPRELTHSRNHVELIDVREDFEWIAGHIPGSRHVPLGRLTEYLDSIAKDRPVVTVCRTGPRSERAARTLQESGYSADYLAGGVTAWEACDQPLVDDAGNPGCVEDPNAEPLDPQQEAMQANFLEIAVALQERFGSRPPTDEEAKVFMREWLEGKGTPPEEIERILED
jgi:rhodanese-related sulfurtransferase